MLGLGLVAILILGLGVATLLRFAPPGQHSGYRAHVDGVYPYDPRSGHVDRPAMTRFRRDQPFAARVEWGQLPASMVVDARWYDSLDSEVGRVGPEQAGRLASRDALVPVITPPDRRANLPGSYTLKVVRYSGSRPVEVLDTEYVAAGVLAISRTERRRLRGGLEIAVAVASVLEFAVFFFLVVPVTPPNRIHATGLDKVNEVFADSVGWEGIAQRVTTIYQSLPSPSAATPSSSRPTTAFRDTRHLRQSE